jgi:hypothetical protein
MHRFDEDLEAAQKAASSTTVHRLEEYHENAMFFLKWFSLAVLVAVPSADHSCAK